jgi:hypothetical protein
MSKGTTIQYKFVEEYSKYPGVRFIRLGPFSGEDFRENVLREVFDTEKVDIAIDATGVVTSFSPSFLDECFGQLAKDYGITEFKNKVFIFSDDNPNLAEKMMYYVERAAHDNS